VPNWRYLLLGVIIGLLAAGAILLIAQPEKGTPIILQPAPATPGVYPIEKSARLGDLITKAGGLTSQADLERVNHAALLRDGDYFYIPAIDEPFPETARNSPINAGLGDAATYEYPLDLNSASQEALEALPGIGPAKAADILEYREKIGRFSSLEELMEIDGIGAKTLESLEEFLIITP